MEGQGNQGNLLDGIFNIEHVSWELERIMKTITIQEFWDLLITSTYRKFKRIDSTWVHIDGKDQSRSRRLLGPRLVTRYPKSLASYSDLLNGMVDIKVGCSHHDIQIHTVA